ncbi:hypothetical protein Tco_0980227, partial [Tanacetum coccineum]
MHDLVHGHSHRRTTSFKLFGFTPTLRFKGTFDFQLFGSQRAASTLHLRLVHYSFWQLKIQRATTASTIWISPLLLLASIECDIVNFTRHHIDSSISQEITPTTFAQPTLLRTFRENNLNDSASVHL